MSKFYPAAFAATTLLCSAFSVSAQTAPTNPEPASTNLPLFVTVTANRTPTAIQRTGSAITVLRSEDIQRGSASSLADVLRQVPGLDITETGGTGATTSIRLRGANAGQTLVLLDGVRLNDPSGANGEFEGALLAPGLIERIEVLRGPQSALYGSDAMGGVINIITKRGRGEPVRSIRVEGGSYGTISTTGSVAGSTGAWSYALSAVAQRTEGFSRYGYRIGRLETPNGGAFEKDASSRIGGFGRIGYDPRTGFRAEVSVTAVDQKAEYDAAFGRYPDTPSLGKRRFTQVSAKAELDTLDNQLTHSLQIFANRSERFFFDSSFSLVAGRLRETRTRSDFIGDRLGAEYQGNLRLKQFGTFIFGARSERETADSFDRNLLPVPTFKQRTIAADQLTNSLFGLWQLPLGERLTVSFGGRYDKVSDADAFMTWRTTAAYNIIETGTKFRASAGTGGKAPTLFQRFSPQYGTANLSAEKSLGVDAGVDQDILGGRVTLTATVFANRFRNLINFETGSRCLPTQTFGCYVNVSRASTSGAELGARATLIEGWLSASTVYTYLHAKDSVTNLTLARRPNHQGRMAFQITPVTGLMIEPSVVAVSGRFSSANERSRLAPYARLDINAEYAINTGLKVHGRVENITNAKYQEAVNYGTTGRAFYGGLTATW
ncbi:MAG: TonB-dependent receptor plug domain-containing protein [Beijerinckiaceae bacterium]